MTDAQPVKSQEELAAERASAESQKAAEAAKKKFDTIKDEDERKIVQMHNEGKQTFVIAKEVYKFVNSDTVGQVVLTIRKHFADDFSEVEDINSTRGYTGV